MKKFLAMILALTTLSSFAAIGISANEINALSSKALGFGHVKAEDGVYLDGAYVYAGYEGIDLTGMKSIEITAENTLSGTVDGDVIWVRLDSPKGEIISTVYMDRDTNKKAEVFKGGLFETNGVHSIYLVSATADKGLKGTKIKSFKFSPEEYIEEEYIPVPDEAIVDTHHTTWALTDTLGRKAATFSEAGPKREGKYVALFYHNWHTGGSSQALNMTEFAKQYPDAKYDYYHPAWGSGISTSYYWNEPLFGYYTSTDYFVARKHAEMLANAGVDFIVFDLTNGTRTFRAGYESILDAFSDARADGVNVPKFSFMNNIMDTEAYSKEKAMKLYLNLYERGKWSDLWFYWEGKPLLMTYTTGMEGVQGDAEDGFIMEDILDFFTFRSIKSGYTDGPDTKDQWNWISVYPQEPYGDNGDGSFEQMVVAPAANYSFVTGDATAMNSPYVTGRSYTHLLGQDKTPGAYMNGYFFLEEVDRLLEVDPEIMFITGWNEWTAGRYASWGNVLNGSPDSYDNEASRDFEPTKGDMGDVYYCLMVDAIRKFKGTEEIPVAGEAKTIDINNLSSWQGVTPIYLNNEGTYNRDAKGVGSLHYKNDTARNNIIKSLVSRDNENLYFYAECPVAIKEASGNNWMKLYIDIDRNHQTGWEGYDYVINSPVAGAISILAPDGAATEIGKAEYVVSGNTLSVKIPRYLVNLSGTLNFEFKWVDNAQGDILNFYVDGNSAPMGRFNYIYTEIRETYAPESTKALLEGVTVVGKNTPYAYVSGDKMFIYEPDTRYSAKDINGVTYIPASFLSEALNLRYTYEWERGMLKLMGENRIYTTLGTNEVRLDGKLCYITNLTTSFDGLPYIPVTFLKEVLGLEIYETADRIAFGKAINTPAVDSLVF